MRRKALRFSSLPGCGDFLKGSVQLSSSVHDALGNTLINRSNKREHFGLRELVTLAVKRRQVKFIETGTLPCPILVQ